jgi:hypothetical protein
MLARAKTRARQIQGTQYTRAHPNIADNRGDMPNERSFSDLVKDHWLPVIVTACVASAGIGWAVSQSVSVGPRDFAIARFERESAALKESLKEAQARATSSPPESPVALKEASVAEGTSVTTDDGRLNIKMRSVIGTSVDLSTTVDSSEPVEHNLLSIGDRLTVEASDKIYFIDLRRARLNTVDLSVSQRRK